MLEDKFIYDSPEELEKLKVQLTLFLQLPKMLKDIVTVADNAENLVSIVESIKELTDVIPELSDEVETCLQQIDKTLKGEKKKQSY